MLYGYCGGHFGRDSYGDKRVEAIGTDWVVARDETDGPALYSGKPEALLGYRTPECTCGARYSQGLAHEYNCRLAYALPD